jgi:hypothetical protein
VSYRVYYCLEGEPGVGHTLGPQTYADPTDALAEIYDLLRVDEVISVTVYTGRRLSTPPPWTPSVKNLGRVNANHRPRQQTQAPRRYA